MNGVLPSLTWGTWDAYTWPPASAAADQEPVAETQSTGKSARKLGRRNLQPPKQSQRWFQEVLERVTSLQCEYQCNPLLCVHDRDACKQKNIQEVIPWTKLPGGIHPRDGKLPPLRARNKRLQVDNLAICLQRLLK